MCIHIALHVRKRFMRVEAIAFVNFSVYNICIVLRYVLMLKNQNNTKVDISKIYVLYFI